MPPAAAVPPTAPVEIRLPRGLWFANLGAAVVAVAVGALALAAGKSGGWFFVATGVANGAYSLRRLRHPFRPRERWGLTPAAQATLWCAAATVVALVWGGVAYATGGESTRYWAGIMLLGGAICGYAAVRGLQVVRRERAGRERAGRTT
jgi:hypothetical protein